MATSKQPLNIIVLGTNGTGKSTFARSYIKYLMELSDIGISGKRRALIVTPHDSEHQDIPLRDLADPKAFGFKKVIRTIYEEGVTLQMINRHLENSIVLFDDCRTYLNSNTSKELHRLLISRRQKNIELLTVAHGFTDVPPKMFTFATHIALFRTTDNIHRRKDAIVNFNRMQKAQNQVNLKAIQNPYYYTIIPQL